MTAAVGAPAGRFGAGLADGADLAAAAERAVRQAVGPLTGGRPDLACVFASGAPDQVAAAVARAAERTAARVLLGAAAGGVLGVDRAVEGHPAVSVWAAELPGVRIRPFRLDVGRTDGGLAVTGLPERETDDAVGLLLADPYTFPADGFVTRSRDALPGLPFIGGLASAAAVDGAARLFLDGRPVHRGAVGALLGGPVQVRTVVSQGCRPVGPDMTVTAADGNVLLQLAGMPALRKLAEVVAELDPAERQLVAGGLQIGVVMDEYADRHEHGDFLIRGVLGADPDREALVVGDVVETGRTVRFQVRDARTADTDLRQLLDRLAPRPVDAALLFTCNGRGAHLFDTADHDVAVVRARLGTAAVAGFFAAGEIGPVAGRTHLHGFTASLLAFDGPAAAAG